MAEPIRCPACGASNPAEAAWCGQCLRRFGEPAASPPAPPSTPSPSPPEESSVASSPTAEIPPVSSLAAVPDTAPGVRRRGEDVVWTCPACENENSMELLNCSVCGTALAKLFHAESDAPSARSRSLVLGLSAVLPGAGHVAVGMTAAGLGRAVLYVWTLLVGLFLVGRDVRRNGGMVHGLGVLFIGAAAAVWILSYVEASRAMRGDRTLIAAGRSLTWATAGLTFLLFMGLALIVRSR